MPWAVLEPPLHPASRLATFRLSASLPLLLTRSVRAYTSLPAMTGAFRFDPGRPANRSPRQGVWPDMAEATSPAQQFDLIVLGGGTGGYVAAIRAKQLGLNVGVVEEIKLGGTCLHRGCIPTKAFLKSADVFDQVKKAAEFGVNVSGEVTFD